MKLSVKAYHRVTDSYIRIKPWRWLRLFNGLFGYLEWLNVLAHALISLTQWADAIQIIVNAIVRSRQAVDGHYQHHRSRFLWNWWWWIRSSNSVSSKGRMDQPVIHCRLRYSFHVWRWGYFPVSGSPDFGWYQRVKLYQKQIPPMSFGSLYGRTMVRGLP